jgi:hypothetical protein
MPPDQRDLLLEFLDEMEIILVAATRAVRIAQEAVSAEEE